jgi:hypothetical protein
MLAHDAALSINHKSSGKGDDSTIPLSDFLVADHNRVVHFELFDEPLHHIGSLFVQRTPITARPLAPYCFCNSTKCGISMRQGMHHVAQKSRTTTLPRKSEKLTFLPFKSVSFQPGAGVLADEASCANADAIFKQVNPIRSRPIRQERRRGENQSVLILLICKMSVPSLLFPLLQQKVF